MHCIIIDCFRLLSKQKEKQANADKKTLSRDEKKAVSLKIPFTVDDIINSPVEEFNDMLQVCTDIIANKRMSQIPVSHVERCKIGRQLHAIIIFFLQRHKLTEPQLQLIRDIRRRGKNKVAAQNCRKRKIDTIVTLEDEVGNK